MKYSLAAQQAERAWTNSRRCLDGAKPSLRSSSWSLQSAHPRTAPQHSRALLTSSPRYQPLRASLSSTFQRIWKPRHSLGCVTLRRVTCDHNCQCTSSESHLFSATLAGLRCELYSDGCLCIQAVIWPLLSLPPQLEVHLPLQRQQRDVREDQHVL